LPNIIRAISALAAGSAPLIPGKIKNGEMQNLCKLLNREKRPSIFAAFFNFFSHGRVSRSGNSAENKNQFNNKTKNGKTTAVSLVSRDRIKKNYDCGIF